MENKEITITFLGLDKETNIEKVGKVKTFIEDEEIDGIKSIKQNKAEIKPDEASAGVLEAVLTIIFSSKAVEVLVRSLGTLFKKERDLDVEIENDGKKIKISSKNINNIEDILPQLESIIKNS